MAIIVRAATEDDVEAFGAVCARAFHPSRDPMTRELFPAHLQPKDIPYGDAAIPWKSTRVGLKFHLSRTVITVAVDDALDGKVVGFSIWERPVPEGQEPDSLDVGQEPIAALDKDMFKEMKVVLGADAKKHFGERGTDCIWHLDYLCVDPDHHRKGVGKKLLLHGMERAKSQGIDCYLVATPAGQPLYRAVGWQDLNEIRLGNGILYAMDYKASSK